MVGIATAGVDPSSLWLTTKIPCSSTAAKKNIEADLQQLGVDPPTSSCSTSRGVDLAAPRLDRRHVEGARGGARRADAAIGVSNLASPTSRSSSRRPSLYAGAQPELLSVGYHDDDTIAYCKREGITYMAYSPLCGGPNGSSCRHGSVLSVPEVQAVAATTT